MSGPARMLMFLARALEVDHRTGYIAALEREALRRRMRVLAVRIIEGRA